MKINMNVWKHVMERENVQSKSLGQCLQGLWGWKINVSLETCIREQNILF